jgi:hypothetical protein
MQRDKRSEEYQICFGEGYVHKRARDIPDPLGRK